MNAKKTGHITLDGPAFHSDNRACGYRKGLLLRKTLEIIGHTAVVECAVKTVRGELAIRQA